MQDHPTPPDPENAKLQAALQRDAERVPEAPFNTALHYATMRRVRALAERPAGHGMKLAWLWAIPGAAILTFAAVKMLSPQPNHTEVAASTSHVQHQLDQLRGSEWAYQIAAAQGDDALLTKLYRDAHQFLPPTPPLSSIANLN